MYKKRKKTWTKKEPIKDLVNLVKRQRLLMTDWNQLGEEERLARTVKRERKESAACWLAMWRKKMEAPMVRLTALITRRGIHYIT